MRFAKALEAERDEIRLMREEKRVLDEKNFRAFEEMMREGLEMRRRREIGKATRGEGGILEDVPSHSGCIGDTGSSLRTGSDVVVPTREHPALTKTRNARLTKLMGHGGLGSQVSCSGAANQRLEEEAKVDDMGASAGHFFAAGANGKNSSTSIMPEPDSEAAYPAYLGHLLEGDIWEADDVSLEGNGAVRREMQPPPLEAGDAEMRFLPAAPPSPALSSMPPPAPSEGTDFDELD